MPYHVGAKGSNGCSGYPVVSDKGHVMGCHPTQANANDQVAALYASGAAEKGDSKMKDEDLTDTKKQYEGCGCATCKEMNVSCDQCPDCKEKMAQKGECCPDDISKQTPCWEGYVQRGMKPGKDGKMVPNCIPVTKSDSELFANFGREVQPVETIKETYKRDFSAEQRRQEAAAGHAMPDGSYPISNRTDLRNAILSWGRGGSDPKVKEHIKRRARALGAEDMIPENWKKSFGNIFDSSSIKPHNY